MKAITQHEDGSELHEVEVERSHHSSRSLSRSMSRRTLIQRVTRSHSRKSFKFKSKGCFRCGGNHDRSAEFPAKFAKCKYCGKQGNFLKVCLKRDHQRVHQIGTSNKTSDSTDATDNSVFLGTLASEKNLVPETQPLTVHSISRYAKRIYTLITLNDQYKMEV